MLKVESHKNKCSTYINYKIIIIKDKEETRCWLGWAKIGKSWIPLFHSCIVHMIWPNLNVPASSLLALKTIAEGLNVWTVSRTVWLMVVPLEKKRHSVHFWLVSEGRALRTVYTYLYTYTFSPFEPFTTKGWETFINLKICLKLVNNFANPHFCAP